MALVVKNLPASEGDVRDMGLIPEFGRSPGGGHGNLENSQDLPGESYGFRGAWRVTIHGVAQSQT